MSAYLERLVNRLIQPEAEIQPRLPGLFEPGPLRAEAAGLEGTVDAGAARIAARNGQNLEEGYPHPAEPLAGLTPEGQLSPGQPIPAQQTEPERIQPIQTAAPKPTAFDVPMRVIEALGEAHAAPAPVPAFAPVQAASSFESAGGDPKDAARRDAPSPPERAPGGHRARPDPLIPQPTAVQPLQPRENHSPAPSPSAAQPILTRLAPPAAGLPGPAAAQTQPSQAGAVEAPQIRVTIGRVEVRAASNPPPAARAKPQSGKGRS